jgi:CheY-like chemotaxis protein
MNDVEILLVEDNHGDVRMVERAFEQRDIPCELTVVQTGDEALDVLYRRGEFADASRPDLVLLDLNLPGTSGLSVLETVKSDETLKRVPVVVLTSAQSGTDLNRVYDEHANACLTKPVDPTEFADSIDSFVEFWAATATLPDRNDDSLPRDGRSKTGPTER